MAKFYVTCTSITGVTAYFLPGGGWGDEVNDLDEPLQFDKSDAQHTVLGLRETGPTTGVRYNIRKVPTND